MRPARAPSRRWDSKRTASQRVQAPGNAPSARRRERAQQVRAREGAEIDARVTRTRRARRRVESARRSARASAREHRLVHLVAAGRRRAGPIGGDELAACAAPAAASAASAASITPRRGRASPRAPRRRCAPPAPPAGSARNRRSPRPPRHPGALHTAASASPRRSLPSRTLATALPWTCRGRSVPGGAGVPRRPKPWRAPQRAQQLVLERAAHLASHARAARKSSGSGASKRSRAPCPDA